MKFGVLGQHLELLVQHLQALLRDVVRLHVVDRNLHVIQAGAVQALDAVGHQQVAVGDHAGDDAAAAHGGDDLVQIRVQQRLAAGKRDDAGAQVGQLVDAADHDVGRDGREKSSYSLQ